MTDDTLLPFALPAIARIISAAANAIRMISFSICVLLVCVSPPPSVAHALERRVKLAVYNRGNLDLAGQRCRTHLSASNRLARFQWARDLRVFGSVRM